MSMITRLGSALKNFRFYAHQAATGAFGWISWFSGRARLDYRKEAGLIYDNSTVLAAASYFWRNLIYPRLIVETKTKDEVGATTYAEIEDHALPFAVENGPFYDDSVLWFGTILSYIVDGNAYWYKVRSGSQKVVGYIYIPHLQIEPRADWNNEDGSKLITYYEYHPAGGRPVPILPEDIVHFRHGIDPQNQMKGLAPIMGALREIVGDNEAAVLGTALMLNGGISAIAFVPQTGASTKDLAETLSEKKNLDQLKERWRENTTGAMAGTPTFIPFNVTPVNLGPKPNELVLDKNRALFVSRICAGLGLDPMILGLPSEQKTYSNYEEASEAAVKNAVLPTLIVFGKQLSRQSLRMDFGGRPIDRVGWDLSHVPALEEDETEKAERIGGLWDKGLIKRSDARRMLKLKVNEAEDNVYITDIQAGGPAQAAKITETNKTKMSIKQRMRDARATHEALQAEISD